MRLSPPGTHFTAESTEAMRIKSLALGENILMLGIESSTFVSKIDILNTTLIVHIYIVVFAQIGDYVYFNKRTYTASTRKECYTTCGMICKMDK